MKRTMEVGQATLPPWTWQQPCESSSLQPHWMTTGTFAHHEPVSAPCGPMAACYMSYIPGASNQAETPLSGHFIPSLSAATQEVDLGRSVHAPDRQQKSHISPAAQVRPSGNYISAAEWAARRHEITELYRFRGWTLTRVMQEMARRGFYAS